MDWSEYEARYIVLVTDAGARDADDPLSGTGMEPKACGKLAQDKGIAIFVLHLLTPATMANHATAAAQYRALADFPGIGSLYYGVPTGDVEKFGEALDALAGQDHRAGPPGCREQGDLRRLSRQALTRSWPSSRSRWRNSVMPCA